jgi:glycosyltransferase involved in cell wall biosynthesis
MKTAIILITKNRQKLLEQTIDSLIMHTPKELYDLIVVDDGSDNIELLKAYWLNDRISDLVLTNFGSPGACRNIGTEIAKKKGYQYLYHTDNDMYFLEGWLEACLDSLEGDIGLVAPYGHPYHLKNDDDLISEKVYPVNACAGNSWFLKLETYLKYGLNENSGIMASEDHDFCQSLRKDGMFCARFPNNKVLHCGITNSNGDPATGADMMLEELSVAKIKYNLSNLYYE